MTNDKNKNSKTESNLYKLISKSSDTGTIHEKEFETTLMALIEEMDYFKDNPSHFSKEAIPNDVLERSCVWAFANNHSKQTVLLLSHFDAVGIEQFGELKPIAFDPEALRTHLGYIEENPEDWIFGRGSCDMKAGIAINLQLLDQATNNPSYPNILFISVPDEENLSAGMRYAVTVLVQLKARFGLNYHSSILTEPHERIKPNEFVTYSGSAGKMMPMIMAKGIPAHTGDVFAGLNPVGILMEIVKAVELNTEMADVMYKKMTPPPTFLSIHDLREAYDVTIPEYAYACFNWMFLKAHLDCKMDQLKELCVWSVEDAINQFNYSYNEFLRKQGKPSYESCKEFKVEVLLFEELAQRVSSKTDLNAFVQMVFQKQAHLSDQMMSAQLIKSMIEFLKIDEPIVVIALLSPFYPSVNSLDFFENQLKETLKDYCAQNTLDFVNEPFFMKICDMSYLKGQDSDFGKIKSNMPLYPSQYQLDFETMKTLDIPCTIIGPWGKDLHLKTERVYAKDVFEQVPEIIHRLLLKIKEDEHKLD